MRTGGVIHRSAVVTLRLAQSAKRTPKKSAAGRKAGRIEEEDRLRGLIAGYQGRLDALPTRESELAELTRDYATLQASYDVALARWSAATAPREREASHG